MLSKRAAEEWAKIFNAVFALDDPKGIEARAMTAIPKYHHVMLSGLTVRLTVPLYTDAGARRFLAGIVEGE